MSVRFVAVGANVDEGKSALTGFIGDGTCASVKRDELSLQVGAFADSFKAVITDRVTAESNGSAFVGALLAIKDEYSVQQLAKAGALNGAVYRKFVNPKIQAAIDDNTWPGKQQFANEIRQKLEQPNTLDGLASMAVEGYGTNMPVLVQSGGKYNLDAITGEADNTNDMLSPDCIVVACSACYQGFTSYLARTYFFSEKLGETAIDQYKFALDVYEHALSLLRPGKAIAAVYREAKEFAKGLNSEWAECLGSDFGFGTGLLIFERLFMIGEKSTAVVRAGMTFVLRIQLNNLPVTRDTNVKHVSMCIADVVSVGETDTVFLTKLKRGVDDVCFRDVEEEPQLDTMERHVPVTRMAKGEANNVPNEEARRQKQLEILNARHAKWLASGGKEEDANEEDIGATEMGRLAKGDQPTCDPSGKHAFQVEEAKQVVWIPLCGTLTPLHVATLQKADVKQFGDSTVLVLSLWACVETNSAFRVNRSSAFLKEITCTSPDRTKLVDCGAKLSHIIQAIKTKDAQRKQHHGVVKQTGLQENRVNPVILKNVKLRPTPVGAGKLGTKANLVAHNNGFKFEYPGAKDGPVIILYENVRHAIFQPAENDAATIFHLNLKQPIMLGNKKVEDIQWIAEVVDTNEQVRVQRMTHEEEMERDEREAHRVKKTNQEFIQFCSSLEKIPAFGKKVQMPYKDFDFTGNSSRAMVRFRANANVLWGLTEAPFWVTTLSDVEAVSLERVYPGTANWDMKFIYKGYRKVTELTTIPLTSIETIKDWLNSADMIYFESTTNIAWNTVLKEIRDDKDWEPYGENGWRVYMDAGDDDEDEGGEDSDSDYSEEDEDSEEDELSEDSSDAELVSSSESVSTPAESDASSSMSWDEMDRRAEEEDRRRGRDDSDDDGPRRKKQRQEPARGAPGKAAPGKQVSKSASYGAKRPPGPPMGKMPPRR